MLILATGHFRFEGFSLDPENRLLRLGATPVTLNARYLDALILLVREQGKLVSKDRFLEEVWRGVPVTDEALTQCIRTLRRQLGDDAASPRFIETAPKHGYRFIAPVEWTPDSPAPPAVARHTPWREAITLGLAGTAGGGLAGVVGGLIYGFAGAAQAGVGAASVLVVVLCVTALTATVGGAGVAFGIATTGLYDRRPGVRMALGGAAGGLIIGAVVKLVGVDALHLLFGQAPRGITGAFEGLLLGGGVGTGVWLAARAGVSRSFRRTIAIAGASGLAAGALIPLLGGRLMAGSLDLLVRQFPQSRLRLDTIGGLFGERGLGPVSLTVTGALEGLLFGACIVSAMTFVRGRMKPTT